MIAMAEKSWSQPLIVIFVLLTGTFLHAAEVQSFSYEEPFGLSHANEILEFDLKQKIDGMNYVLLDDKGRQIPWQIARNGKKLLVRTDLAANEKATWRLVEGKPQAPGKDIHPGCRRREKRVVRNWQWTHRRAHSHGESRRG